MVIAVMINDGDNGTKRETYFNLQKYFEEELYNSLLLGRNKAMAILTGVSNSDYTYNYRKTLEKTIRDLCGSGREAFICFSKIYTDISMISHAYTESVGGLHYIIAGKDKKRTVYTEELSNSQIETAFQKSIFKNAELNEMEEALRQQDEVKALQALNSFSYIFDYKQYSNEAKRYLRYCILQKLIEVVNETHNGHVRDDLLAKIMKINPDVNEPFDESVTDLIKQICFSSQKEDEIKRAIQYIQKNFQKYDLSLEEVAGYVGLSKSYLSKKFKIKTGKRYIDYVSEIRMEEAKRLLMETQLSVQEIVWQVGYSDLPNFCRKFKAVYGMNTSGFRNNELDSIIEETLMDKN